MAIEILLASGQIGPDDRVGESLFLGELSLDGSLRHTNGMLPMVALAAERQFTTIFVPVADAMEAALIRGIKLYPIETLGQLVAHLNGERLIEPYLPDPRVLSAVDRVSYEQDMAAVRGQEHVKRALEVAASGGHNILMSGPPGSGKTLLARSAPSIPPRRTIEKALDVTKIYSVSAMLAQDMPLVLQRPFRIIQSAMLAWSVAGASRAQEK